MHVDVFVNFLVFSLILHGKVFIIENIDLNLKRLN